MACPVTHHGSATRRTRQDARAKKEDGQCTPGRRIRLPDARDDQRYTDGGEWEQLEVEALAILEVEEVRERQHTERGDRGPAHPVPICVCRGNQWKDGDDGRHVPHQRPENIPHLEGKGLEESVSLADNHALSARIVEHQAAHAGSEVVQMSLGGGITESEGRAIGDVVIQQKTGTGDQCAERQPRYGAARRTPATTREEPEPERESERDGGYGTDGQGDAEK